MPEVEESGALRRCWRWRDHAGRDAVFVVGAWIFLLASSSTMGGGSPIGPGGLLRCALVAATAHVALRALGVLRPRLLVLTIAVAAATAVIDGLLFWLPAGQADLVYLGVELIVGGMAWTLRDVFGGIFKRREPDWHDLSSWDGLRSAAIGMVLVILCADVSAALALGLGVLLLGLAAAWHVRRVSKVWVAV